MEFSDIDKLWDPYSYPMVIELEENSNEFKPTKNILKPEILQKASQQQNYQILLKNISKK